MVALPAESTNPVELADWLELSAIAASDGSASSGDLDAALTRAAIFRDRLSLEAVLTATMLEVSARSSVSGTGYPFEYDGAILKLGPDVWTSASTYLLCLSLTAFGRPAEITGHFPERIFEEVATVAAAAYLAGSAVRFGSPRNKAVLESTIYRAVGSLCERYLAEGEARRQPKARNLGDEGVDVVAWKPHSDARPGKLILFGACATGGDWRGKLRELQPDDWSRLLLTRWFTTPIAKAFFVPFRIANAEEWIDLSTRVGIPFDRCRISALAPSVPATSHGDGALWAQSVLRLKLGMA